MKKIVSLGAGAPVAGAVLLLTAVFFFLTAPVRATMLLYPPAREVTHFQIDYSTREMLVWETEHFLIKYSSAADQDAVKMVAAAAEEAYSPVGDLLNYRPAQKTLVIVHHDRAAMRQAYGWSGEASAMGFYWGGVIQVLSPEAWQKNKSTREFIRQGPMAHEFTHLTADYLLRGNYPRWFTEGLAQYAEYKFNGYEWLTENNSLQQNWYSLRELDQNFDRLDNQALAYRQSLAIVRYIAEIYGQKNFSALLAEMRKGISIDKAVKNVLGVNYSQLEGNVFTWAGNNMTAKLR